MNQCKLVQDLLPLYEENLVSEETKSEIEHHLKECPACSEFYGTPLPKVEIPIHEDEKKSFKQLKKTITQQQYFTLLFSLSFMIYVFLVPLIGIETIPWAIIIPFTLTFMYKQPRKIFMILILLTGCLMITTKNIAYCLFIFLQLFIYSGAGISFAYWIIHKHKSTTTQVLSLILCGGLLGYALMAYSGIKGNLITYWQAKTALQTYIDDAYNNQFVLTDVSYQPKMGGYAGDISDKQDSRNSGTLYYYPKGKEISDDYQFRIQLKMEEEVQQVLELLIDLHTDLNMDQLSLYTQINLPMYEYSLMDSYDPTLPAGIKILDDVTYESKESFAKQIHLLLQVLQFSGLRFDSIAFYSFLEDGNQAYTLTTSNTSLSLEEIINQLIIEESLKGKEYGI